MIPPPLAPRNSDSIRPLRLAGILVISAFIISCAEELKPVPELNPEAAVKKEVDSKVTTDAPKKPGQLTRMTVGDLYQLSQSNAVLIYDVRPKLFYSLGHIPRATNWPKADFKKDLEKHEENISAASKSNKPIVIYCTDLACPDAAVVAKGLAKRGHNVSILQGGYEAWKAAVH